MGLEVVEIYDKEKYGSGSILGVTLTKLLECLNNDQRNYYWTIFDLDGLGKENSDPEFRLGAKKYLLGDLQDKINSSSGGIEFTFEQLLALDKFYTQIWDVCIAGNKKKRKNINEKNFDEYRKKNDLVLELFDCTRAIVSSHSHDLIENVKNKFHDVREVEVEEK